MGEVFAQVKVTNALHPECGIDFRALVDTGASNLVLPLAWKERLGEILEQSDTAEMADSSDTICIRCGPVVIEITGFGKILGGEVVFIPMVSRNGEYEPLLGYIPLEALGLTPDVVNHRLVQTRKLRIK